jgi:cytochrome c oxidase subunit 2
LPAATLVDTRRVYGWVYGIYLPIAIGVFFAFTLAIIGAVIWYRSHPPARAARWHEANRLEISYALLLTCVAAFLLYISFNAEHQVDTVSADERPALTVYVTGSRWEWIFHYPAYGITHESGFEGAQPLVVPTNEPIRFNITSADVIHGFWIPELDFKRDAIPGITQRVTLDFDKSGRFAGACSEFCGLYHTDMVFTVDAVTPAVFRAWTASRGRRSV